MFVMQFTPDGHSGILGHVHLGTLELDLRTVKNLLKYKCNTTADEWQIVRCQQQRCLSEYANDIVASRELS